MGNNFLSDVIRSAAATASLKANASAAAKYAYSAASVNKLITLYYTHGVILLEKLR